MSSRRVITYILLGANWIIAIGIAIVFFIFLNYRNDRINQNHPNGNVLNLAIIAPVIASIISSCLLVLYQFLLNRSLVDQIPKMNPKLLNLIKSTSYVSITNVIIPNAFVISGLAIDDMSSNQTMRLILLILGFAFCVIIGLGITGYTSYINFRISFNEQKRRALLEGVVPEMKMYEDKTEYKDEKTKKKYEPKKSKETDDSLATSRSFN